MQKDEKNEVLNPYWLEQGYSSRFQVFQNLMRFRIRNILLVSSLYDLFLLEEDGRLYELIREEYQELHLSHSPELTRVSSAKEAMELAREEKRFDLIISTLHIEDMPCYEFAKMVKESDLGIPIVLLAYDHRELSEMLLYKNAAAFDEVFVWQGDFRLLIAIIKILEDRMNVDHDTRMVGVQSMIIIEDKVQYYSSFLPMLYMELFNHQRRLIGEGVNLSHKFLRMRARPKILLFTNYDDAWQFFTKYNDYILGVISDIDFKRHGVDDPQAGLKFAKNVKKQHQDVPILLQSDCSECEQQAYEIGASFALKGSPTLLHQLSDFMLEHFGFGDFVFRLPSGAEVGRATNLKSLEKQLYIVPEESIRYHSERNHFSNWLKARTEFGLAHKLRPVKVSDFDSVKALREKLISSVNEYRRNRQRGIITDFKKEAFYPQTSLARIGGGSLGGKARGLSFLNKLLYNFKINNRFDGVKIFTPPALVIGTDVFDRFLDDNDLRNFALNATNDEEIRYRFVEAEHFPADIVDGLRDFLQLVQIPLAVRSSSLLEDSQYFPFAGVYSTLMIPNNDRNLSIRLNQLLTTIKMVYASTFYQNAKSYFEVTSYRLEEEKMAIVIQKLIGSKHHDLFYPDISGAGKSYNFYPVEPQTSRDGIVSVALGLGKTVFDGGETVKFSPKYPNILPQFNTVEESLKHNQQSFYALNLSTFSEESLTCCDGMLQKCNLDVAEKDGTLKFVGSTYSHENYAIYDGISRSGYRIVTMAPILKHKLFQLPEILEILLDIGTWAMGMPVEIEFAANLSVPKGSPTEFGLLQMRPLVLKHEVDSLDMTVSDPEKVLCQSDNVLGNGSIDDICDIVFVDINKFNRLKSREVANEVHRFNLKLLNESRPYLLIGVGRWGTLDPFLGIPVKWEQISGAKVIVEAGFEDFVVSPSQGSHFFHNLTSFRIGYFTIGQNSKNKIDWDWLSTIQPFAEMTYTKHLRFQKPVTVKMNGHSSEGLILKPK